MVGTIAGGMTSPAMTMRADQPSPTRSLRRWSTKPTIADSSTIERHRADGEQMLFASP